MYLSMGYTLLRTKRAGRRRAKEHDTDDISLLFTWRKKNSSLDDVFRKEGNNGHLYLPASGGTPLVGELPYGSADVRNLHEEMHVFPLGVISFISFNKKWRYELTVWNSQVNPDIYYRVVQPFRIFPSQIVIQNRMDAEPEVHLEFSLPSLSAWCWRGGGVHYRWNN